MINKQNVILTAIIASICLLVSGCQQENYLVNEARSMMLYQKNNTDGNLLNLAKAHAQNIKANADSKNPQIGLYADYATCLAKLGLQEEANKWYNKELIVFPASEIYVKSMKAKYCGSFAPDCTTLPSSKKPDEKLLEAFAFTDADEDLEPVLPDVSDEFSDDPASIIVDVDQLSELSDKEVKALERGKNAKTDEEKAMTKEEREKAKKQAAKEKEKAKKKAAKEKEKAKKKAAKEKAKAKKQAAKEKEIARQQAAREKELAREKAVKEKEQAREQVAKEKQQAKEQAAQEREQQREQIAREREQAREEAARQREDQARQRAEERESQKKSNK